MVLVSVLALLVFATVYQDGMVHHVLLTVQMVLGVPHVNGNVIVPVHHVTILLASVIVLLVRQDNIVRCFVRPPYMAQPVRICKLAS